MILTRFRNMEKDRKKRKLRKWSQHNMDEAFKCVQAGKLSISAAAKTYSVPRMTLADRLSGRVKLAAKMGASTYLSAEDETSLCNYIDYMAKRGFPLTISDIKGFAFSIAKERGHADTFEKDGPSRKWWRGFKKRHPEFGLRRTDALDRGRAVMGSTHVIKGYFDLLKATLDENNLFDQPQRIYNCDEAALYLNKSTQKVVVPIRQKHAHSLAVATSEHISVHCCVNAAGSAIPPMVIFSGSLPGGPYHKNGPINALYSASESGFMNKHMYFEWFEKCFLKHCVPERPVLLIQDGASSHVSVPLLKSAIANDVILLSLPPKTTHILQPLDVAVYRKMKIETAKVMSQVLLRYAYIIYLHLINLILMALCLKLRKHCQLKQIFNTSYPHV